MKKNSWWSPAGLVLFLTWLFFGMYYMNRFNFSPMIPLLKSDLNISNAQAGWLMALFFITYTIFQLPAGYLSYFQPGVDFHGPFTGAMCQRSWSGHGMDVGPQTDCQLVSPVETRNSDRVFRNLCNRRQQYRLPTFRISR